MAWPYAGNTSGTDSAALLSALNDIAKAAQITNSPTYIYTADGYPAYATPTDLVGINGSASKTIRVHNLWIVMNSTAAALQTIHFVKRSAANTGGTDGAPVGIPRDSANPAPTATLHSYTSAPSLGASVGDMALQKIQSTVLTTNGGVVSLVAPIGLEQVNPSVNSLNQQGVTLRGVNEGLFCNYAGAALAGASPTWTASWGVLWSELPNTF